MGKDTLVIASSANERFALGLTVLLCSIVLSNSGRDIRFYIMEDGILPETKDFIVGKVSHLAAARGTDVEIRFHPLTSISMPDIPQFHGSYSTYARMFFSDLFEESSLYYVDADMLCNRPFPPLADMESLHAGHLIAGCQDEASSVIADHVWSGKYTEGAYVNTGFLWMNLSLMREVGFGQWFHEAEDVMNGIWKTSFHYHDQTLLNCLCHGRIGLLPGNFNVLGPSLYSGGRLNLDDNWHFTGPLKPWLLEGRVKHLTVPFHLYHLMLIKLSLQDRLAYAGTYLPLRKWEYLFRHVIAARLWVRSEKRFRRFQVDVENYLKAKERAAVYATQLDELLEKTGFGNR